MKTYARAMLAVLVVMIPTVAHAGAGAVIRGCIYLPVAPINPLAVSFTAGDSTDHCMVSKGNAASVIATAAGITCVSVGYVEGKSSSSGGDTCASDDSIWNLSYSISGTAYSGSTKSSWWHPPLGDNHIALRSPAPGTVVCGTQDLCDSTTQTWDGGTQGPLFIIFKPQTGSAAALAGPHKTPAGL